MPCAIGTYPTTPSEITFVAIWRESPYHQTIPWLNLGLNLGIAPGFYPTICSGPHTPGTICHHFTQDETQAPLGQGEAQAGGGVGTDGPAHRRKPRRILHLDPHHPSGQRQSPSDRAGVQSSTASPVRLQHRHTGRANRMTPTGRYGRASKFINGPWSKVAPKHQKKKAANWFTLTYSSERYRTHALP